MPPPHVFPQTWFFGDLSSAVPVRNIGLCEWDLLLRNVGASLRARVRLTASRWGFLSQSCGSASCLLRGSRRILLLARPFAFGPQSTSSDAWAGEDPGGRGIGRGGYRCGCPPEGARPDALGLAAEMQSPARGARTEREFAVSQTGAGIVLPHVHLAGRRFVDH